MKAVASFPHTQRKKAGGYQAKDNFQFMLMVLPTLVLLLLFHYLPMFGVVIAFQDFSPAKGFFGSQFVGLKNFEFFFKSQDAGRVIGNTVSYALVFLALDNALAIGLALMFYCLKSNIGVKVYNTVMILPRFLSIEYYKKWRKALRHKTNLCYSAALSFPLHL